MKLSIPLWKCRWLHDNRNAGRVYYRLLELADHELTAERGQLLDTGQTNISLARLCVDTGLTKKAVRYALDMLNEDGFIEFSRGTKNRIITICEFDSYKCNLENEGHNRGTIKGTINDAPNSYGSTFYERFNNSEGHNQGLLGKEKENVPLSSPLFSSPAPPTYYPPIIPPKEKENEIKGGGGESACARKELFEKFFSPERLENLERICIARHIESVEIMRQLARTVVDQWIITGEKIPDEDFNRRLLYSIISLNTILRNERTQANRSGIDEEARQRNVRQFILDHAMQGRPPATSGHCENL